MDIDKTNNCTHPVIKKLMAGEYKGAVMVENCLVAHYFNDGSLKSPCWRCPDCGMWISYEERLDMRAKCEDAKK